MARSVPYIRTISDTTSWRQDQALNATIYILREIGPTGPCLPGYLLKEEGERKKFKVLIGDPHACTCPTFRKEKDVCKHICWILLKKFKVPRQNPVTWQRGLVEREINELLRGLMTRNPPARATTCEPTNAAKTERPHLEQREISEEDVCPICQDEFLAKHEPVTYCKFGCGNNVHIKCMKIWAEHQKSIGEPEIKCPMCRQDFGPYELLKQEYQNSSTRTTRAERLNQHLATMCHKCRISPIHGKCYKCVTCADLYLCQTCFNTDYHRQHSFVFRQKPSQRWRDVERGLGVALPQAVVRNLMGREIKAEDYDLLLQLDNSVDTQSDIPEEFIKSLPYEKIRSPSYRLLQPGVQCRICLRGYEFGQFVRRLPCNHRFHVDCIDAWLMHQRPSCPVDGQVVWSPGMQQRQQQQQQQQQRRQSQENDGQNTNLTLGNLILEIPGIGLCARPAHQSQPTNQSLLRVVDGRGEVRTSVSQLTMTGTGITATRPRWLPVENRVDVTPTLNSMGRLPPTCGRRLTVKFRPTPSSMTSLTRTEIEVKSAPGVRALARRASEDVPEEQTAVRGRTIRRPSSLRSPSCSRERQEALPVGQVPNGSDVQSHDLSDLYLGQSPSRNDGRRAISREKVASKPRPQHQKIRPSIDTDVTIHGNSELDMGLIGYNIQ